MKSFLQSPEWEEFQKAIGRKTWRARGVLIISHHPPFGFNYSYSPRPDLDEEYLGEFLKGAEEIAAREKSIFLKVEPGAGNTGFFNELGFIKSAKEIQPSETVILDLTQSEQE